jgi:hypothetical protein
VSDPVREELLELQRRIDSRFDSLEGLVSQVSRELRARKVKGGKRSRTVAQRAAAEVTHTPTALQREFVRQKLAHIRPR